MTADDWWNFGTGMFCGILLLASILLFIDGLRARREVLRKLRGRIQGAFRLENGDRVKDMVTVFPATTTDNAMTDLTYRLRAWQKHIAGMSDSDLLFYRDVGGPRIALEAAIEIERLRYRLERFHKALERVVHDSQFR